MCPLFRWKRSFRNLPSLQIFDRLQMIASLRTINFNMLTSSCKFPLSKFFSLFKRVEQIMGVILWLLAFYLHRSESAGCGIFQHHFAVNAGTLTDICGGLTLSSNTGYLLSSETTLEIRSGMIISFSAITMNSDQWAIVFDGVATSDPSESIIIFGGGDTAHNSSGFMIYGSSICIESSANSNISECIQLPHSVSTGHPLILYHENEQLQIYQNSDLVSTITGPLGMNIDKIGGGNMAVRNIMFANGTSIDDIQSYLTLSSLYLMQSDSFNVFHAFYDHEIFMYFVPHSMHSTD